MPLYFNAFKTLSTIFHRYLYNITIIRMYLNQEKINHHKRFLEQKKLEIPTFYKQIIYNYPNCLPQFVQNFEPFVGVPQSGQNLLPAGASAAC